MIWVKIYWCEDDCRGKKFMEKVFVSIKISDVNERWNERWNRKIYVVLINHSDELLTAHYNKILLLKSKKNVVF